MLSMLVVGLGRFGSALAVRLAELGNEVLAVDTDEEKVTKVAPFVTHAQIADCMDADTLSALGARNFDRCFVCIGESLQSSLEITSILKELGAPYVIAKAGRDIQARLLLKVGADEVIYPERDMGYRVAARVSARGAFDYFELSPEYVVYEISPPKNWVGRSVREANVRGLHNINIIGVKPDGNFLLLTDPEYRFREDEHILVAGSKKDLQKLLKS